MIRLGADPKSFRGEGELKQSAAGEWPSTTLADGGTQAEQSQHALAADGGGAACLHWGRAFGNVKATGGERCEDTRLCVW